MRKEEFFVHCFRLGGIVGLSWKNIFEEYRFKWSDLVFLPFRAVAFAMALAVSLVFFLVEDICGV